MAYLLDADVLITAARGPYGFDICPGFWEWLDEAHAAETVFSVNAVEDEVVGRGDELSEWARDRPAFFLAPDTETVRAVGSLVAWANASTHYNDRAKYEFADSADVWLIAAAGVHDHTVVTHERPSNEQGRIKIPVAAAEVGARVMDPYAMLRHERVRFIREPVA